MQCQQANELFSDYVEGALDRALAVSIDNHLAACASCREEMVGFRRVWTQLDVMPVLDPPASLHADIIRQINLLDVEPAVSEPQKATTRNSGGWDFRALFRPRALAFAATLLVFVLGSLQLVQSQRAALGPFDMILRALHGGSRSGDAPEMQATRSEWIGGEGSGTLKVHLQAQGKSAAELAYSYHAELSETTGGVKTPLGAADGHVSPQGATTVSLPLTAKPTASDLTLTLTFAVASAGSRSAPTTLIVPLKLNGQ